MVMKSMQIAILAFLMMVVPVSAYAQTNNACDTYSFEDSPFPDYIPTGLESVYLRQVQVFENLRENASTRNMPQDCLGALDKLIDWYDDVIDAGLEPVTTVIVPEPIVMPTNVINATSNGMSIIIPDKEFFYGDRIPIQFTMSDELQADPAYGTFIHYLIIDEDGILSHYGQLNRGDMNGSNKNPTSVELWSQGHDQHNIKSFHHDDRYPDNYQAYYWADGEYTIKIRVAGFDGWNAQTTFTVSH